MLSEISNALGEFLGDLSSPQLRRGIIGRKPPSAFLPPWKRLSGDDGFWGRLPELELGLADVTVAAVVVVMGVRSW